MGKKTGIKFFNFFMLKYISFDKPVTELKGEMFLMNYYKHCTECSVYSVGTALMYQAKC